MGTTTTSTTTTAPAPADPRGLVWVQDQRGQWEVHAFEDPREAWRFYAAMVKQGRKVDGITLSRPWVWHRRGEGMARAGEGVDDAG